jgi:hypothetical protein
VHVSRGRARHHIQFSGPREPAGLRSEDAERPGSYEVINELEKRRSHRDPRR